MPYFHLETTADLPENSDIPDILEALCAAVIAKFDVDPLKTRASHTLRSVWVVGHGAPPAFVHLTLSVHGGRPPVWKAAVAESLLDILGTHFKQSLEAKETSLTVEVRDMDPNSYRRIG